jgi:hypothetical protein
MRRRLIIGLFALNGLLGIALLARPAETQIIPRGFVDCCKKAGSVGYCCANCCWFIQDCADDKDCKVTTEIVR